MSAANNPKNIYCVGSELNDTFSNFQKAFTNVGDTYKTQIGLVEEVYDPNTGSNATLYGKLNYILEKLSSEQEV